MSAKAPHLYQTASHWGVYEVAVNGDAVSVAGAYADDRSPSPLIHSLPAIVRGAERVRRPSVRRERPRPTGAPTASSKSPGTLR